MRYLCEPKDFSTEKNETKQNFVKTESEELRKFLLNALNFHSSIGWNMPNVHPFLMAWIKVNGNLPIFDKFSFTNACI